MEITRLADLKPRTVWEITDDAFDLYRERFAVLSGVSAAVFVPVFLLIATLGIAALEDNFNIFDGPKGFRNFLLAASWILPVCIGAYVIHYAATAVAVRDLLTGELPTIVSVYKRTYGRFFPLLFTALFIALLSFVSVCTYIGPLLVAAYYCFAPHGIVLEDRKIVDSAKRSRSMAQSYFGKSLGMLCLMLLIGSALVFGVEGIIALGFAVIPTDKAEGDGALTADSDRLQSIVITVAGSLATVLIAPLPAIATTLLYYDLRVRREGLDLESEAIAWGVTLAPDPFHGELNPKVPKPKKGGKP